jgi:hypothetical protein
MADHREKVFDTLRTTAAELRSGEYSDAACQLNRTLQDISRCLREIPPSDEGTKKILYSLETMLMMQQQKDWVALADVIEHEFCLLWKRYCFSSPGK